MYLAEEGNILNFFLLAQIVGFSVIAYPKFKCHMSSFKTVGKPEIIYSL